MTGPSSPSYFTSSLTSYPRLPPQWKEFGGSDDDRRVVFTCRERPAVLMFCPVDIMAFIKDNPPPATIILISGDRDFAYLLSTIRWRKYNVVLISNSFMTHESLTAQGSVTYDWQSDILKVRPSSKPPLTRPRRETLSSVASLTTPQESDNSREPAVHAAGLPDEHTPPATQPPPLSPRPVSIATINTIRPTPVTPPPNTPPVEPEVIPMPPTAETPAEPAPASVPSTPTSDGQIVTAYAGESPTVHSSIVQGFVANP